MAEEPGRWIAFDGSRLALDDDDDGGGRRFQADARCFEGKAEPGALANVCALTDDDARIPFDDPLVQQLRRDVLAWWVPLLGDSFVCFSTLALDESHCAGAITVVREPSRLGEDPAARLFPATLVESGLFSAVLPPAGPVIERYAGAPWPAGGFG